MKTSADKCGVRYKSTSFKIIHSSKAADTECDTTLLG